jgi:hypothetical protein
VGESHTLRSLLIFLSVFAVYWLTQGAGQHSELAIQAYCMLHGQMCIDGVATAAESVVWVGKHYLINPPLGAVLLMPWVALTGSANQTPIAIAIAAAGAALVSRLGRTVSDSLTLAALWAFGTVAWYGATNGDSWHFSLLLSTIPTLIALDAAEGGYGAMAGVFGGLAALARFDMAAVLPVYGAKLRRNWLKFALCVLPAALLYVLWSEARFGLPIDQAERLWWAVDTWAPQHGTALLSLRNIPFNLETWLLAGPTVRFSFPYFVPSAYGQSILLTTPAFLLALRARKGSGFLWAGLAAALVGPALFYANGWIQYGCRFWIQGYPFLFALMARQPLNDRLARVLIVLSVVFCGLGMWAIHHGGFVTNLSLYA